MKSIIRHLIPTVMMLTLSAFTVTVHAESKCKGMNQSRCSANSSCLWVNGYVTKNGKKVDGYCRIKSSKQKTTAKEKVKKTDKQFDKGKKQSKTQEKK